MGPQGSSTHLPVTSACSAQDPQGLQTLPEPCGPRRETAGRYSSFKVSLAGMNPSGTGVVVEQCLQKLANCGFKPPIT